MLLKSRKNEKFYLTVEERIIYNESNLEVQPKEISLKKQTEIRPFERFRAKEKLLRGKGGKSGICLCGTLDLLSEKRKITENKQKN